VTVRRQLQLVRWGTFFLCAAAIFAAARHTELPIAWILAIVFLLGVRPVQRRAGRAVAGRAFARLGATMSAERFDEAHAILDDLRGVYARAPSALELLRVQESTLLVLEGRFGDAIRLFDSIDRRKIRKEVLPWLLNNLAWALARAGDGPRAIAVARESIEASGEAGEFASPTDDLRACQLGTLGAALVVAGQPSDALDPLGQALARGGSPRLQASRGFYLGEALHALGREDEARDAWKRAADACPEHDLGRRARHRLDAPSPPYRS
jgi:tetratricopeptide (TPR) repeat protein